MLPLWTLLLLTARAEYRAFEIVIKNKVTGQERVELSNLDPQQYRDYHPLDPHETIAYRSTWMCKGNTSDKQICPRPPPRGSAAPLAPASKP